MSHANGTLPPRYFEIGERVVMTKQAQSMLMGRVRSPFATVHYSSKNGLHVWVIRDGQKRPGRWSSSWWRRPRHDEVTP